MSNSPSYIIQPIPGKGLGAIAARPIAKGEKVISEAPLFTQHLARTAQTIETSLASKTPDEKRQFFELTNCHPELPDIHGIFETNALPCGDNDMAMSAMASAAGLFLLGSRINSSCVPNLNNYWNEGKHVIEFRALKDIAQGEEMCIAYTLEMEPRAIRRSMLQERFSFKCHCAACSLSGEELKASDDRRKRLKVLFDEIRQSWGQPALGVRKVKIALRLLQQEGLVHGEDSFSYDAFQFCVASSDLRNAKKWIQKSWNATCSSTGEDSERTMNHARYNINPKAHPAWGIGRRMTLGGPEE